MDNEGRSAHIEHSHSKLVKLVDELLGLSAAIESNGTFESHHRDELDQFLDQLEEQIDGHVEYEEEVLFPSIRDRLDESAEGLVDSAVEQHRELLDNIERLERTAEATEQGDDATEAPVADLLANIEEIHTGVKEHDRTEQQIFKSVETEGSAE